MSSISEALERRWLNEFRFKSDLVYSQGQKIALTKEGIGHGSIAPRVKSTRAAMVEKEKKKKKKTHENETEEERKRRKREKKERKKAKREKEEDGEKRKKKKSRDEESGEEAEEVPEEVGKKKRKQAIQHEEEEDEAFENLPEVQKEAILYDRQVKRKEQEEREAAKKKLQIEQKGTVHEKRHSARDVKKPAISKALENYAAQKTGQKDDDESTDDEAPKKPLDESSEEEPRQEREPEQAQVAGNEEEEVEEGHSSEVTCKQVVNLQVRRAMLEKTFGEPWFKDYILKKFVRVNVGERPDTGQIIYRMAEIVDVKSYPRPYKFGSRNTQLALLVRFGLAERIWAMTVISNSSITEAEFDRWKKEMRRVNERILTSEEALVLKKAADFHRTSFKYTPEIVQDLLEKKKKENLRAFNLTTERNKIMHARAMAQENGDEAEVARLHAELEYLDNEEGMIRRRKGAYKAGLVALNIKNRERNLHAREQIHKEINKAERLTGKQYQQEDYYSTKMTLPAQIWTAPEKDQDRLARFEQAQAELAKRKKEMEDASRVKRKEKPSALVLTDPVEEDKKDAAFESDVGAIFKSTSPSDVAFNELVAKHKQISIDISQPPERPKNTLLIRRVPLGDFQHPQSLRDYLEERDRSIKV